MLGLKRIYRRLVGGRQVQKKRLAALPRAACDTSALGVFTASWLTETFADGRINADWDEDGRQIADLDLPEMTGGANPGDCRALDYLVRRLKPQRILEIWHPLRLLHGDAGHGGGPEPGRRHRGHLGHDRHSRRE